MGAAMQKPPRPEKRRITITLDRETALRVAHLAKGDRRKVADWARAQILFAVEAADAPDPRKILPFHR